MIENAIRIRHLRKWVRLMNASECGAMSSSTTTRNILHGDRIRAKLRSVYNITLHAPRRGAILAINTDAA